MNPQLFIVHFISEDTKVEAVTTASTEREARANIRVRYGKSTPIYILEVVQTDSFSMVLSSKKQDK